MQEKSLEKSIAFQKAAGKEPSSKITDYVFDFEREAKAFFKSYQECTGRECPITFIDASHLPDIKIYEVNKPLKRASDVEDFINRIAKYTHEISGGSTGFLNNRGYIALIIPTDRIGISTLGYKTSADITDAFIFDHEIGHSICPDAYKGNRDNLKECIADAYAAIRHYQRFGVGSTALDSFAAMHAVGLVFRPDDGIHFTSPVVQHIIEDRKNIDFTSLTLEETAQIARRYAALYAPHSSSVERLANKFQSFNEKLPDISNGDFSALRQLAKTIISNENPEEFKWGSLALRAILDGKVGFNQKRISPVGQEWMDVRKALDERDAELKETGILFGIQKPKPAAQNNKKALQCL
jgi:hypothetical protein